MSRPTIYFNPRCSKSRGTLQLLTDRGLEPKIIEYLETPPTVEDLDRLATLLGCEPLALIRTKEAAFTELGLTKNDARSRDEWLRIMVEHPSLIQRPIVVLDGKAALGRPPENVLDIL